MRNDMLVKPHAFVASAPGGVSGQLHFLIMPRFCRYLIISLLDYEFILYGSSSKIILSVFDHIHSCTMDLYSLQWP